MNVWILSMLGNCYTLLLMKKSWRSFIHFFNASLSLGITVCHQHKNEQTFISCLRIMMPWGIIHNENTMRWACLHHSMKLQVSQKQKKIHRNFDHYIHVFGGLCKEYTACVTIWSSKGKFFLTLGKIKYGWWNWGTHDTAVRMDDCTRCQIKDKTSLVSTNTRVSDREREP